MTNPTIALKQSLSHIRLDNDDGILSEAAGSYSQMLTVLEADQKTGAAKQARSPERQKRRNGCRDRSWETRAGEVVFNLLSI